MFGEGFWTDRLGKHYAGSCTGKTGCSQSLLLKEIWGGQKGLLPSRWSELPLTLQGFPTNGELVLAFSILPSILWWALSPTSQQRVFSGSLFLPAHRGVPVCLGEGQTALQMVLHAGWVTVKGLK